LPGFRVGSDWRFHIEVIESLVPRAKREAERQPVGATITCRATILGVYGKYGQI
jgi:hypothetical protein